MSRVDTFRSEETREALLAQVVHLVDEMNAFTRHFGTIPSTVLEGRPVPSAPSFKEIYGLLAAFDKTVYVPAVEAVASADTASIEMPEEWILLEREAWNEMAMPDVVERVRSGRAELVAALEKLGDWTASLTIDGKETDVFGLAYGIVQHDAALLRAAAQRLHESRLTSRDEDLPK